MKFGHGEWLVGSVYYDRKDDVLLAIIIPAVIVPMLLFIAVSVYCYRFVLHPIRSHVLTRVCKISLNTLPVCV